MYRQMLESNRDRRSTKSNAVPICEIGIQYHAVHKAITIYYSSTVIFTEIKVKQNFSQQLRRQNVLLFQFCLSVCALFMLWSAHVKHAVLLTALDEA